MELYEQIRREYEHGAGTIREVARKLGVHRREVRRALASALPPERKKPERARPKLAQAQPYIDAIVESDRRAPRKQRHTAHRISHPSDEDLSPGTPHLDATAARDAGDCCRRVHGARVCAPA